MRVFNVRVGILAAVLCGAAGGCRPVASDLPRARLPQDGDDDGFEAFQVNLQITATLGRHGVGTPALKELVDGQIAAMDDPAPDLAAVQRGHGVSIGPGLLKA